MEGLSIRITDHSSGVDQTIEISPVRNAVAAAVRSPTQRFIDNGDGTITDITTGLMWSKENVGGKCNWEESDKACRELGLAGHKDWRMPTRWELLTLVDDTRSSPAIDTSFFTNTENDWYWTSTLCAWAPSCAWVVSFGSGSANVNHRSNLAFVRAVRSARASQ